MIDVKNSYVETADEVARADATRSSRAGVPPERLTLVPDCGFSQTARHLDDRQARRRSSPAATSSAAGAPRRPSTQEEAPMTAHAITMLGTGLIGDFYTTTLHGQRGRDRVRVVYSRSRRSAAQAFSERWGIPERTTDLAAAIDHPDTDVVVVGAAELPPRGGGRAARRRPARRSSARSRSGGRPTRRSGCSRRSSAAGVFGGYLEDLCYTPKTLKAVARGRRRARSAT